MLLVAQVKSEHILKMTEEQELFGIDKLNVKRSSLPAVHIDYSARVQTVDGKFNKDIMI